MKKKDQIRGPWDDFFDDLFGPVVLFVGGVSALICLLPFVGIGIGIGYWIWG
ncbi:hypothetical protein SEA_MOAB_228 [Streptomyces phage Moab]|nr:hypothetical protein SEA_MOAB_228 [Streptomyces phage Moab]